MRKGTTIPLLAALAVWALIGIQTIGTAEAVEEHHGPETQASTSEGSGKRQDAIDPGTVPGAGAGPKMMGMTSGPGEEDRSGMMGPDMMGPDMMGSGMMGPGMMRMMMGHMMGGPGGMGNMMSMMGGGKMGGGMRSGGPGGMARMGRMLEQLDLTPEQWDRVRSLARDRLEKMADLWARRMKLQIELASLRWGEKVDAGQVKDLFVRKAESQAEMLLASLDYMHALKAILNPEQRKRVEGMGF